jgi:hypothetical protein
MFTTPFSFMAAPAGGYDPDAQAYIDAVIAAGGTLSSPDQDAVNTCFVDLKLSSLYSKMVMMYPLMGGNSSGAQAINAVNIGTYNITWNGGITFGPTGAQGNGSGFGDTGWVPTNTIFTDGSFGVYTQNGFVFYNCLFGAGPSNGDCRMMIFGSGSGGSGLLDWSGVGGSLGRVGIAPNAPGQYIATSTAGGTNKILINGSTLYSNTGSNKSARPNTTMKLFKREDGYEYEGILSFAYVSEYLTDGETITLSAIINDLQTSLSRNVY